MSGVVFFPVAGERAFSPDEFVTRAQLAESLKVSESTVDRWAKREVRPLPAEGWGLRLVRFRVASVQQWLEREERTAA